MKKIILLLSSALIFGCATTSQKVPFANMAQLKSGNALISVKRLEAFGGGGRTIEVSDNGKIIGEVSSGKSLSWQRKAGNMQLMLTPSAGMVVGKQSITSKVKSGKRYSYEIYIGSNGFSLKQK